MKNHYLLALLVFVLLILNILFGVHRFGDLSHMYESSRMDLDFFEVLRLLNHELIVSVLGLLAFMFVLFNVRNRLSFSIVSLFVATQLGLVIFTPTFSIIYLFKVFIIFGSIWLLLTRRTYTNLSISVNGRILYVGLGLLAYVLYLYLMGYLVW